MPDPGPLETPDLAPDYSGIRVVIVAHGPPLKGGVTTVAMDLVEDPVLNAEFDIVFLNTTQNESQRGKLSMQNVTRAVTDAWGTFRLARRGAVVHSHSVQEPWPVAWRQAFIAAAARLRGARVLLHNHAGPPNMAAPGDYRVSRPNRWAFSLLDRLVDANVVISVAAEPNIRQFMAKADIPVVANSVVVGDISTTSAVHNPRVLLFIGELVETKGLVTLLDALDLLDARGVDDYEVRIVGNNQLGLDPLKDEMINLISARGRGDSMTGPLERSEVYRHLSEADVFVLPTFSEGQPFSVIEALAAGVPIVASDIPSISNMIEDGVNGRLVPVRDAAGLADALTDLLDDPDGRHKISAVNRELAATEFDRSVFRAKIARLYRTSAQRRDRAGR